MPDVTIYGIDCGDAIGTNTEIIIINEESIAQTVYNKFKPDLQIMMGLLQHNFRFVDQQYDSMGKLLSGKIKIFNTSSDANNNISPIQTYTVQAQYSGNNLIDYKVTAD